MVSELRKVINRDLETVYRELELYPDDDSLWSTPPGCANPGGTLVLHIVGNLRHYIGAQLGGTLYVRDREAEFATRNVERHQLQQIVAQARDEIDGTFERMNENALSNPAQAPLAEGDVTTGLWLMHLAVHLSYHLGQLDYHRRLVTGDATSAGAMALSALVD